MYVACTWLVDVAISLKRWPPVSLPHWYSCPWCIPIPHWIELTCVTRRYYGYGDGLLPEVDHKMYWDFGLALSRVTQSGGSQLPCHGDAPSIWLRGLWDEELRLPSTCQPYEWVTLELDFPAPVRPSGASAHTLTTVSWKIPAQLSGFPTPETQKLYKIIMFNMTSSFFSLGVISYVVIGNYYKHSIVTIIHVSSFLWDSESL